MKFINEAALGYLRVICLHASVAILASPTVATNAAAATSANEIRALVIGVDQYSRVRPLTGAVNDARDIAETLQAAGAKQVIILEDGDVTATRIKREWEALRASAPKGSTLLLAYSGHGFQHPEHTPGDENDGKDELIVFGAFDPRKRLADQREAFLIDNEWRGWLAESTDYRVITVFDSCHSGSMSRSLGIARRVEPVAPSQIARSDIEIPLFGAAPADSAVEPGALPHELYIGGATDQTAALEFPMGSPMQQRGALSYYFTRALRGYADRDRNGTVTVGELVDYLEERIPAGTEQAQVPSIRPGFERSSPVLASVPRSPVVAPALPVIPLFWGVSPGSVDPPAELRALVGVDWVKGARPWLLRVERDAIHNYVDEEVARTVRATNWVAGELQGVVDKWRTVRGLLAMSESAPLRVTTSPGDYKMGESVSFGFKGVAGQLVLFNIASDGQIQPLNADDQCKRTPTSDSVEVVICQFEAALPAGADHLVAVDVPGDPAALQQWVRARSGTKIDGRGDVLKEIARLQGARIGVAPIYTH